MSIFICLLFAHNTSKTTKPIFTKYSRNRPMTNVLQQKI